MIQFRTEVMRAKRVDNTWLVTTRALDSQQEQTHTFDYIVAAHGRCNAPYIPAIPGISNFRGRQIHSAWYRYPDTLQARRIMIVGNNSSGADIARELCGGAVRTWPTAASWERQLQDVSVFHSYQDPTKPPPVDFDPRDESSPSWCRRIQVVGPIQYIDEQGVIVFHDGRRLSNIDMIVWATGFMYQVPFFHASDPPFAESPLVVRDEHTRAIPSVSAVSVLHQLDDWMLFYRTEPSVCFLGLPNRIVPFPMVQLQARVAAHIWLNKMHPLPRARAELRINDPERWNIRSMDTSSSVALDQAQLGPRRFESPDVWGDFTMGADAEAAYTDALLSLLPAASNAPEWAPFPTWRRELRKQGKAKRREILGY